MKELWRSPGELEGEQGFARFALHLDCRRLLTGVLDGPILKLWDLDNSELLWSQSDTEYSTGTPIFSADGKSIFDASCKREDLWFFDTENGRVLRRVEIPGGQSVGADFHSCLYGSEPDTVIINCCGSTACLSTVDASVT